MLAREPSPGGPVPARRRAPPRSTLERWFPLAATLRAYDAAKGRRDLVAGLTVALFTIPQAMAYALIAGMPPVSGIFAAVAASILGAAFGSSEFLINGPTNAISVVLAAHAALFAANGDPRVMIFVLTLMIGAFQLLASAFKLGNFTRFVSEPVLTGFTAGAGIYIAANQIPSLLGLEKSAMHPAFTFLGWTPASNAALDFARSMLSLGKTNLTALATGAAAFGIVRGLQWLEPRLGGRRLPAPFLAVLVVTAATYLLDLGDPSFGADKLKLVRDIQPIRRALPRLYLRPFGIDEVGALLGPTVAIATLGAVEAIAIGKSLAASAKHTFEANRQLVGEGVCNLGAALLGGFASSGSFSRTAVNHDAGAVTRLSCIFSGLLTLGIMMLFAPAANYIPVAALAGTLIHIGLKLVNVGKVRLALQTTSTDRKVLLTTFVGVLVFAQLEDALFAGIIVSVFLALRRAEGFKLIRLEPRADGELVEAPMDDPMNRRVLVLELQGELFFAAAEVLSQRLADLAGAGPRFIVLRMSQAYNLDATCAEALAHAARHAREHGGRLVLTGVRPGMYATFERSGLIHDIGPEAVFRVEAAILSSTFKAIAFAQELAGEGPSETSEAASA